MENLIGKYVWIEEDDEHCWVAGSKGEGLLVEAILNNNKLEWEIDKNFQFMEVHRSCLEEIDDLLNIGEYNEPSVLHIIRERYFNDKICTLAGSHFILYVNPYKTIEENENYQNYYNNFKDYFLKIDFEILKKTDLPNINMNSLFYLAHKAYFDMLTGRHNFQNFIISGESGSGKSNAFKLILNYFSFLSVEQASRFDNPLETMIPEINNVLEAFGNAANDKNNNSSRFTKYFDIFFNNKGKIISLKLYCYFLERSRVVKVLPNEANFHIFYMLINGSNDFEKKIYHIKDVSYFKYLANGLKRESSKEEDLHNFQKIKEIFLKLKFSNDEVKSIFTILSSVLYLGNIEFDLSLIGQLQIRDSTIKDFLDASVLLGIDQERLRFVLTKAIKGEKSSLLENAYINLKRISKVLYSKTFSFIVKKINTIISYLDLNNKNSLDYAFKIGIADFFGFENKDTNEFEQFCRNYTNEVLNQYYVNYRFKQQQEEYLKENIDWAKVNFNDNCDLLNLIDDIQEDSVFSLIEKTINSKDKNLISCLKKAVDGKNSKLQISSNSLIIKHYNGEVSYNLDDFLENNIDYLEGDISVVFEVANNTLLRSFFKKTNCYITKTLRSKMRKLFKLLYQNNNILYVKCANPVINQDDESRFNSIYLNKQLKSMGLIEILKINKQCLPIKLSKETFVQKYLGLMTDSHKLKENHSNFDQIFKDLVKFFQINSDYEHFFTDPLQIKIGVKNVYLDEKIMCFLQSKLNHKFLIKIIKFQAVIRKFIMIRQMNEIKTSVVRIQIFFKWRIIFKRKLAKNHLKNLCQNIVHKFPSIIKSMSQEYHMKKQESDKMIRLEFKKIRERFHKNNTILNEISINLISEQPLILSKTQVSNSILENSFNKDLNASVVESRPKIRKIRRVPKTENIIDMYSTLPIKEQIIKPEDFNTQELKLEKIEIKKTSSVSTVSIFKTEFEFIKSKKQKNMDFSSENLQSFSIVPVKNDSNPNPDYYDDIKNLKNMIMNNENTIDILNLKITELTKTNNFLNELNESLKVQLSKSSEKWNKEIQQYHSQIKEIELQKNEIERKYTELEKNSFSNHFLLNDSIGSTKSLRENFFSNPNNNIFTFKKKKSTKKKEDYLLLEKEISTLKTTLSMKDVCINELQKRLETEEMAFKLKNDQYEVIKSKYEFCKNKITEFNVKLSGGKSFNEYENEIISLKNEFDVLNRRNEAMILELQDKIEEAKNNIDHLKKKEEVLKDELEKKEMDLSKRQELIKYIQGEIDKISNENTCLKKENLSLKENINKLEINEIESKARHFNEMQSKNQENLILTSKIKNIEKLMYEMREVLKKKQNLLTFKRSVNRMLIELLQMKKSEILLIDENKNSSNPEKIAESISIIREKEKTLLNKMNNMANLQEYTTDSDDESDDETQIKTKSLKDK